MSYQVLARQWRPHRFQEIVGQEHVLRMLMNALNTQRLHHAYLFTGTRGVGKTTIARLLAKCLNCETGVSANPCNQCNACLSIDAGKFLDLIEVDAASRTKVEDTRELLENVQYAPTQGRYKIYLIDEVHMLSGHSFNALLKTLEEPPLHVKFLLATTDPKRLPVTILSRCLQFNLKRVPLPQITQQLQHISTQEGIQYELPALELLAHAADGSMRDALSLLDQALAFCQHTITTLDIRQMLGCIEQEAIFRLLQALASQDGNKLFAEITLLAENAPNFSHILEDILSILHQISIVQVIANAPVKNTIIKQLATQFPAEEVQLYYQIALIGRRDLLLAPNPMQGFEMIMLRMLAFKPSLENTIDHSTKPVKTSSPNPTKLTETLTSSHAIIPPPIDMQATEWRELLTKLDLTGMAQALASNCTLTQIIDNKVELALSVKHKPMFNKKLADRIEQALSDYFKKTMKLEIQITATELHTPVKQQQQEQENRLNTAIETITNDSTVQTILDIFDAKVDFNSIKTI